MQATHIIATAEEDPVDQEDVIFQPVKRQVCFEYNKIIPGEAVLIVER